MTEPPPDAPSPATDVHPAAAQIERNLGEQPIAALMATHALKPTDLVRASTEFLTHKMVSRACRGRRLTTNMQGKLLRALNAASGHPYALPDLFTYT